MLAPGADQVELMLVSNLAMSICILLRGFLLALAVLLKTVEVEAHMQPLEVLVLVVVELLLILLQTLLVVWVVLAWL